jgi:glutathione synthase/RimK-type ligase-like ATP-grasp enzyme
MGHLDGFVCDDDLAHRPLMDRGWMVTNVSWRSDTDWSQFDLVVIRSTWDYQNEPQRFLEVLRQIEESGTRLENPLGLVRWNLRKTYLFELEQRGAPVVPAVWYPRLDDAALHDLFDRFDTPEIVLKPEVGANADHAYRLSRSCATRRREELVSSFRQRPFLAQPFLPAITEEGEFSLFYFLGELSHCILKTPKPGDFRVQEEHGGIIQPAPPEPQLLEASGRVMAAIPTSEPPLYARTDLVRDPRGDFRVMEVELIEPALYFRMDSGAAARFAEAIERLWSRPAAGTSFQGFARDRT